MVLLKKQKKSKKVYLKIKNQEEKVMKKLVYVYSDGTEVEHTKFITEKTNQKRKKKKK